MMNRSYVLFLVCFSILLVLPGWSQQDEVYVDAAEDFTPANPADGDTVTWNGSSGNVTGLIVGVNAFTSVQDAVNAVSEGGTVFIAAGDYFEGRTIGVVKSLTLQGDGAPVTNLTRDTTAAAHRILRVGGEMTEITIDALSITHGLAGNDGGGIQNFGILMVINSRISENVAGWSGGGIFNESTGTLNVMGSTISGNEARRAGGGIWNEGILGAINSTVSGNVANGSGGGIVNSGDVGEVILSNTTVTGNTALGADGGGGITTGSTATLSLSNSLIVGNIARARVEIRGEVTTDNGGNLLAIPERLAIGDILAPLADNGGPTFTHALVAGSPAIDGGLDSNIPTVGDPAMAVMIDQRGTGFPRNNNGGVDIGSFESLDLPGRFELVSFSPEDGSVSPAADIKITLNFGVHVVAGAGEIILKTVDGDVIERFDVGSGSVTFDGMSVTITPTMDLPLNAAITFEIPQGVIEGESEDVFSIVAGAVSFSFCPPEVYVDAAGDFTIDTDLNGDGFGLGDIVTWNGSGGRMVGLTVGGNAFTSVQDAVDAVCDGGTVFIAAGDYFKRATININKSITLQGDGAAITNLTRDTTAAAHRILRVGGEMTEVTIDALSITHGLASRGGGGGIRNFGGLTVKNSMISGNMARNGNGGGIYSSGTLSVTSSTILENMVEGGNVDGGGGIFNEGMLDVTNSTISGNESNRGGGGIWNEGILSIINSTISGNVANGGGGISNISPATFVLSNSLIVGNRASRGAAEIAGAITTDNGGNLLAISAGLSIGNILAPLADNGGPTFTHALVAGSPAIDGGLDSNIPTVGDPAMAVTIDQRGTGFPRNNNGGVDIGSFESLDLPGRFELVSFSPEDGSVSPAADIKITLNFGIHVAAGAGEIILKTVDGDVIERFDVGSGSVTFDGMSVTITPTMNLPLNAAITFEIPQGVIEGGNGEAFNIAAGTVSFTFCPPEVYVDEVGDFTIETDLNDDGFGAGDTVTWNGNGGAVTGLIVGVDAFTSVQDAVDAVCEVGTVFIAAGDYFEGRTINIEKSLTLQGDGAAETNLTRDPTATAHRIFRIGGVMAEITIDALSITNGLAGNGGGGGIRNFSSLTVMNSTIRTNVAGGGGGGGIRNNGTLSVMNSTISGNEVESRGGGGINNEGILSVTNSTVSGNVTDGGGGGIANSGEAILINATVSGNTANGGSGGGIINLIDSTLALSNSLIVGNMASFEAEIAGAITTDNGGNLLAIPVGLGIRDTLAPLADNGGPTLTHALVAGSPAIDAGLNENIPMEGDPPMAVTTDQRGEGFDRIIGNSVDIGAVELLVTSSGYSLAINIGAEGKIAIADLLALSPGSSFVSVDTGTTVNGNTVDLVGGFITFVPRGDFMGSDFIIYTSSTGTFSAEVTVGNDNARSFNLTLSGPDLNGEVTVIAFGIPGRSYRLQDSLDLMSWSTGETNEQICPPFGQMVFTDTPTAGQGSKFYRVVEDLR